MSAIAPPPGVRRRSPSPPRLSRDDRVAQGRAARTIAALAAHGEFAPAPDRPGAVAQLESQATSRVPDLVPIRYGRMLTSPFAFYRGAAKLMATDLGGAPDSGLRVQLCGDAHLANFGVFASPERRVVFDLNDFDETLPGPFEWDVKRLAASVEVAARNRGMKSKQRRATILGMVSSYRLAMLQFAAQTNLAVWYAHIDVDELLATEGDQLRRRQLKRTTEASAKARTRDSIRAFNKLTAVVDGKPRIVASPPLIVPIEDLVGDADVEEYYDWVRSLLQSYHRTLPPNRRHLLEQFTLVHIAHKVVGVGSVGLRAWILLLEGIDRDDPLFLQAKEATVSVLEPFAGASAHEHHGQRVVLGQQLMQAHGDIFLGWPEPVAGEGPSRDFYLRQLSDWKWSADVDQMDPAGMASYASRCAWTLARAHARSGDRVAIAAYLGGKPTFDEAIADYASAYADQNDRDYAELRAAVSSGQIIAITGQ